MILPITLLLIVGFLYEFTRGGDDPSFRQMSNRLKIRVLSPGFGFDITGSEIAGLFASRCLRFNEN